MSIATYIFTFFQLSGMAAGAFSGYKHKNTLQTQVYQKAPIIQQKMAKFDKNTQEQFFATTGALIGIYSGYYLWPVVIPLGIFIYKTNK